MLASVYYQTLYEKINSFQYKAIATKTSVLDTACVPDAPLITVFGKITLTLA